MSRNKTKLTPLAQAVVIRSLRHMDTALNGAALVSLRKSVLCGLHDNHEAAHDTQEVLALIKAVGLDGIPPDTELVALLLEALSQRLGAVGHAQAWQSIGINAERGRKLLSRNSNAVDWPVWKTLRDAALGAQRH